MRRRHPAEMTADRIADHLQRYSVDLSLKDADTLVDAAILLRRLAARAASDSTPKG